MQTQRVYILVVSQLVNNMFTISTYTTTNIYTTVTHKHQTSPTDYIPWTLWCSVWHWDHLLSWHRKTEKKL